MAQKEKVKRPSGLEAVIGKEAYDKMGHYKEATGGGEPIPAGEKLKDHPEIHRVKQPRDEDGRFTYNAVNFKTLSTDTSRGKTVPPFLRGVKINFASKGRNDVWWNNDKRYIVDLGRLNKSEFIRTFQVYHTNNPDYGTDKFNADVAKSEDITFTGLGGGKETTLSKQVEAKRGALSKQEQTSKGQGDGVNTNYDPLNKTVSQEFGYYFNGAKAYCKGRQAKAKFVKKNPQKINPNQAPSQQFTQPSGKFDFNAAYNKKDAKSIFLALPKDVKKVMIKSGQNKPVYMKQFINTAVKKQKITDMDDFVDFMRRTLNIKTNN